MREQTPVRDYIYIDDLVEGLFCLGMREISGVYNFGSGASYSCDHLCKTFLRLTNKLDKKVEYLNPPRKSMIYLDIQKTIEDLNWQPYHDLQSGIAKLLETWHE